MPHISEFPIIFICNKKHICLPLFLFPFPIPIDGALVNFKDKNKTLHLQNNIRTKFQQLWRNIYISNSQRSHISQHLHEFHSYDFAKSTHIYLSAAKNIFSLRIHALIITILLCYFRVLVLKKYKKRNQMTSFFFSWFTFRYVNRCAAL